MTNKKAYTKPEIKSEKIQIGVFGDYGASFNPVSFIRPTWLWGVCCRG